jgi:hypothetical protein
MNLMESLPSMSWRRFSILLKGLGPSSTFVLLNSSKDEENPPVVKKDKKRAIQALAGW